MPNRLLSQQRQRLQETLLARGAEQDTQRAETLRELNQVHGQRERQESLIQRMQAENANALGEAARMHEILTEMQAREKHLLDQIKSQEASLRNEMQAQLQQQGLARDREMQMQACQIRRLTEMVSQMVHQRAYDGTFGEQEETPASPNTHRANEGTFGEQEETPAVPHATQEDFEASESVSSFADSQLSSQRGDAGSGPRMTGAQT